MKKTITTLVIVAIVLIIFFMLGPFYVVEEGEQAVVIRFGEIVSSTRDAGLKFKSPVVDNVVTYSKRILPWDGDPRRIPTAENQFVWVDTTARWKIVDPELFYASTQTLQGAYSRLDDIIESAVRTIIAENSLSEAVRNSNVIFEIEREGDVLEEAETEDLEGIEEIRNLITSELDQPRINKGRRALSEEMYKSAAPAVEDFGIELVDIVIRQIRYSDDLTESVYNRMISERQRIAEAYRSFGQGRKQEILGELAREKDTILSEAFREAETIRGRADAQVTATYAESYGQDPDFFRFWRAVESYRTTLPKFRKTLTTDLDYFEFLYSDTGR
jgi:membrane protease subunit HflC